MNLTETLTSNFLRPPAYPKSNSEFVRRLKQLIDIAECPDGLVLQPKQLGNLLGMPKSTLNDWHHGDLPLQLRFFICALERLSESSRAEFLRRVCRECPRLDDPWIVKDERVLNSLQELLKQPTGLTLVHGSDAVRL